MKVQSILLIETLTFLLSIKCSDVFSQEKEYSFGNNSRTGLYVKINNCDLYYETYGKGKPLFLIHGNGGSIESFKAQIPFFDRYFRVIAVDSRLHGKSGGSNDSISYEMIANDFASLMDYLNLDSAYFLGWSDGGIVGLILSMKYPKKVKKLAVSGANIVPDTSALYISDINNFKNRAFNSNSSQKEKLLNRMMVFQPQIPYSALNKIGCPVLIMAGDRDIIKPEHTLKIYQSIPKAFLCIFPNSYHNICQQKPELFNEIVFNFFQCN